MKDKILCSRKGKFLFVIIPDKPEIGVYAWENRYRTGKIYEYADESEERYSELQGMVEIHKELCREVWGVVLEGMLRRGTQTLRENGFNLTLL